jgi:hypothetical protein
MRSHVAVVGVAVLLALGCEGTITDPGVGPGGGGGGGGGLGAAIPAPSSRVPRLTHAQWENTVVDLLRLDGPTGESSAFRPDPVTAGYAFDNDGWSMSVDQTLWGSYNRAAATLAEQVTSDATALGRIVPAGSGDDATRGRAFVEAFGARAYRRPLSGDEANELFSVWQMGSTLYTGVPAFEAGARLVIEAVLQSPFFLYRVESSATESSGVIPLTDWEIATRLSYALWNTMPDDVLFAAAAAGELRTVEQVAAQATRLLADPRAEDVVARYHELLLEVERYAGISPSASIFPDVTAALPASARAETDAYVRHIFTSDGGWTEMLTSTDTFVDAELARIYGLEGTFPDDSLVPAQLDTSERRGLFTHVGFLAANATSVDPDPIHRGIFLVRRVACVELEPPAGAIPPLPPPMGRTNRETVEDHTEQPGSECAACHAEIINPFGFPFEIYDAVGAFRTEDNGYDVDASASPPIGGERVSVRDALGLASALAQSEAVHACYAGHWVEFVLGRHAEDVDATLVAALAQRSVDGASLRELLVAVVTSRSFLARSLEEEMPE